MSKQAYTLLGITFIKKYIYKPLIQLWPINLID